MDKYYKFNLDMKLANIIVLVFSFILLVVLFLLVNNNILVYKGNFILTLYLLYLIVHELFHGLGYRIFIKNKKNLKYGITLEKGVLYAMCQERLSKKAIIISLLMPITILSILVIPFGIIFRSADIIFLALLNFVGSLGDVAMVNLIRKMPKDINYVDFDNNIGMYLVSKNDLSKYGSRLLKYESSGEYKESLIDKSVKKIFISKQSIIYIVVFIILDLLMLI